MGTRISALLVTPPLERDEARLRAALGVKAARRVGDRREASFGTIRYENALVIPAYGSWEDLVSECIERETASLPCALFAATPNATCLAVVLNGTIDLAAFALFAGPRATRRFATADEHGVFVDVGPPLPAELEAAELDYGPEDLIHTVTESVMGFDLIEVLRARDDGALEEVLLQVE